MTQPPPLGLSQRSDDYALQSNSLTRHATIRARPGGAMIFSLVCLSRNAGNACQAYAFQ